MEVAVFEYQTIYDVKHINTPEQFIDLCRKYIPSGKVDICLGNMFVSCADVSGEDKPILLVLTGHFDVSNVSRLLHEEFRSARKDI